MVWGGLLRPEGGRSSPGFIGNSSEWRNEELLWVGQSLYADYRGTLKGRESAGRGNRLNYSRKGVCVLKRKNKALITGKSLETWNGTKEGAGSLPTFFSARNVHLLETLRRHRSRSGTKRFHRDAHLRETLRA